MLLVPALAWAGGRASGTPSKPHEFAPIICQSCEGPGDPPPPSNAAPTVQITAPSSGTSALAPASFTVQATAADSDGTVASVKFYSNGALIGSDITSPYAVAYSSVAAGNYSLTALATDDFGKATTSSAVSISVTATPPPPPPPPSNSSADAVSDRVGVSPGEFRVSETGAATYTIPIYTAPGTAGVAPKLALSYSSQAGDGPLGKGWSISGTSAVSRCRASRESGDSIVNGQPVDADGGGVVFFPSDKFCLDGQRLIPAPATAAVCPAFAGATATNLRAEIESFQRVCAYSFDANVGPRFFTVERKDGSTSWYGDRTTTAGGSVGARPDGVVEGNASTQVGKVLTWAQTRFQDSVGNYIDYLYQVNPAGAPYIGEQVLKEVQYTGKVVLPGQTGSALAPYAQVTFDYTLLPVSERTQGFMSYTVLSRTQQLAAIKVSDGGATLRYYPLSYAKSVSGSSLNLLTKVRECADESMAICHPPTIFDWSTASNHLGALETPADLNINDYNNFDGYKLADVDGDGRQDMVWLTDGNSGQVCTTEYVVVAFGTIDASGANTFSQPAQTKICTAAEESSGPNDQSGMQRWYLFDYDGDGRADIFMSGVDQLSGTSATWKLYRSLGRPTSGGKVFDNTVNLAPVIYGTPDLQLGDFNGDGLLDAIYNYPNSSLVRVRLMERNGSSFVWSAERTAVLTGLLTPSEPIHIGKSYSSNGGFQLMDFNGDSHSDLLIRSRFAPGNGTTYDVLSTFMAHKVTPTQVMFLSMKYWFVGTKTDGVQSWQQSNERFADINGDGLVDLIAESVYGGVYTYELNTGTTFKDPIQFAQFRSIDEKYLQVADVNGDGRADVLVPSADFQTFDVMYALPAGGFANRVNVPGGAKLINCTDECMNRFSYLFSDFDGDGATDFFSVKWTTGSGGTPDQRLRSARAAAGSRFKPRDVVTRVTDGLGALNDVTYMPLTIGDVYRRDTNSRNSLNLGRGAPVQDVLGPAYVVAKLSRSAPTAGNPSGVSGLFYRYAGAKVQAGGRGNLGFRQVDVFDGNTAGKILVSSTSYNQTFPYIGTPGVSQTAVVNGYYTPSPCLTAVTESCFVVPGQPFPAVGGTVVSKDTAVWEAKPAFDPAQQRPAALAQSGSEQDDFDLATGARVSRVRTTTTTDAWGNALQVAVDTFTGAVDTSPISSVTSNTYTNDEAHWRLSRLTAATVTHSRNGQSVLRRAGYGYDMSGPVTGFLTSERTQPNGPVSEDLRTEYALDAYGNRIASYTCSQNIANCQATSVNVSVWASGNTVHRYGKQTFDVIGRFPTSTIEAFRKPGSAWGSGEREEVATATVLARDVFGNVTKSQDLNGAVAMALNGAMGRSYWSWTPTVAGATAGNAAQGIDSFHTFRYCGASTDQVACPTGAVFREKLASDGAPSKWTYYDLLGRPMLVVAESANAGRTGWDFSAACTWYDLNGRKSGMSEPFFLASASTAAEPSFASGNPCVQANRDATYSFYDVLGRPTQLLAPDGGSTTVAYAGLATTTTNPKSQKKIEVKNAVGQLVSVTDNIGFTASYTYDAAGNLAGVSRDAGRGAIVTSMSYDALGRKISLNDPDAGLRNYSYTPAGEVEGETKGNTWTGRRYDFRGRVIYQRTSIIGSSAVEEQVTKEYDLGANARGQLVSSSTSGVYSAWVPDPSQALAKTDSNTYDALGRLAGATARIDGQDYASSLSYDALGRPYKRKDASGKWAKTEFSGRGFVVRICESSSGDVTAGCVSGNPATYLETLESDARGNVTREKRGGSAAMLTERSYDPFTGRLTKICAGAGGTNCQIANEQYGWDQVGNLQFRERSSYLEELYYDGLNRLTNGYYRRLGGTGYTDATRPTSAWASYDKLGNVCGKAVNGVGRAFMYHGRAGCGLGGVSGLVDNNMTASPHQVVANASINTNYAYDADGNQLSALAAAPAENRYIRYTLTDKAYEIAKGSQSAPTQLSRFWYDAEGPMYKRQDVATATGTKRTIYVGNVEIVTLNGSVTTKRYVAGVAVQDIVGVTVTTRYMHHDHLGSVVAITSDTGAVQETLDYAPFGERRNFADPRNFTSKGSANTNQGFTGHEMVDGFGIVHMRGRIYDSVSGRFLQVDPIIQDPSNPQNYDRYTYVWNNPLGYTDPTGMASFRQQLRSLAGALISAYLGGSTTIFGSSANGVFANASAGFIGGVVATGNLRSGLASAFSVAATQGMERSFRFGEGPASSTKSAQTGEKYSSPEESELSSAGSYHNPLNVGRYTRDPAKYVRDMAKKLDLNPERAHFSTEPFKDSAGQAAYMSMSHKGILTVYPAAFDDLGYWEFGSAMYHEKIHFLRDQWYWFAADGPPRDWKRFSQATNVMEVEAYKAQVDPMRDEYWTRTAPRFKEGAQQALNWYRSFLTEENLNRVDRGDYDCQGFTCQE